MDPIYFIPALANPDFFPYLSIRHAIVFSVPGDVTNVSCDS